MKKRLALDQSYPTNILPVVHEYFDDVADVLSIRSLDARMADLDDWQLIASLAQRDVHALVVVDSAMVSQERELAALAQTRMSLVVAEGAGGDPVLATGLFLTYLQPIVAALEPESPKIWRLKRGALTAKTPWNLMGEMAARRRTATSELFESVKLSDDDLTRNHMRRR